MTGATELMSGVQIPGGHFSRSRCEGRFERSALGCAPLVACEKGCRLTDRCSCQARKPRKSLRFPPIAMVVHPVRWAAYWAGRLQLSLGVMRLTSVRIITQDAACARRPEMTLGTPRAGPCAPRPKDRESLVGLPAARRLRVRSDSRRRPGTGPKWDSLSRARSRCLARCPAFDAA